jgi:hypothetical protein
LKNPTAPKANSPVSASSIATTPATMGYHQLIAANQNHWKI